MADLGRWEGLGSKKSFNFMQFFGKNLAQLYAGTPRGLASPTRGNPWSATDKFVSRISRQVQEFPRRVANPKGSTKTIIWKIFPENCLEMKKIGLRWGRGHTRLCLFEAVFISCNMKNKYSDDFLPVSNCKLSIKSHWLRLRAETICY